METGTVKWFNVTKGFGFITPDQGKDNDIFVHISTVETCGLSTLNEGQKVEYEVGDNRGRVAVTNIKESA
jgi:CspA family cold shock protein